MRVLDDLKFYKDLFSKLPVAIFIADLENGNIVDANEQACSLIELEYENVIKLHQSELHPEIRREDIKESFKNHVKNLLENKDIEPLEHLVVSSSGKIIPVEITPRLIDVEDKKYILGLFKDLRTRKFHENLLYYYDKALEKSSSLLAFVDKNYVYRTVNESYTKMFKISKDEIVGKKVYELVGNEYFENNLKEKLDLALEGKSVEFETVYKKEDREYYLKVNYEPYYSLTDEIIGIVVNVYDLTKHKEYEEENIRKEKLLVHQSKMAAMGEMLENIAHQWRQPLSVISTCTSGIMLQREFNTLNEDMLDECLNNIMDTTSYLSNTIDDFKNFFEKDRVKVEFKLQDVVNKTLDLVEVSLKESEIEIVRIFTEDVQIKSYKSEFMQVLLNIINNAKDALCSNNELKNKKKRISVYIYKNEEDKNVIKIVDNAGGIKDEILDKIFEPYFTTKHKSQGTGIGLFMTRQIVTKHMEASIECRNVEYEIDKEKQKGACFKIIFN